MQTMSSQVLALVAGLLKAARSDAALRKVLDESPQLRGLVDPLQPQPRPEPQPQPDAPRGSTSALRLTKRQCDVLRLIAVGRSNKEIARITGITPETVKTHVKNIFVKLAVEKRAQAVARAHTLGLVPAHTGESATVFQ